MRDLKALTTADTVELEHVCIFEIPAMRNLVAEGYMVHIGDIGWKAVVFEPEAFTVLERCQVVDAVLFPGTYPYSLLEFIESKRFDSPISISCTGEVDPETCILVSTGPGPLIQDWYPFDRRGPYMVYVKV
jgi:hypothetical protein